MRHKGALIMKQVDKYIQLYKESKITPSQVKSKLKARKYNEFWGKLYKAAENN